MHGVKDVVKKPTIGAKEEGASGLMKGLGKGFVGVITRPTSSAATLTSVSCDVIRRYMDSCDHPDRIGFSLVLERSLVKKSFVEFIVCAMLVEITSFDPLLPTKKKDLRSSKSGFSSIELMVQRSPFF